MAITPGTSTSTSGNQTTGFTLVINAGVVADDVLLLGVTNRGATTDPVVVDNDTGGNLWARVGNQNAAVNGAITVWWKRATSATAGKTITVSLCTNSASGCVTPYTGCVATGTPHGTPVSEANASGNETQAGITTGAAGSFVCLFVGCTSNDTLDPNTYAATDPTTLIERANGISSGGSDCLMAHASAVRATAGATGSISWAQTDGTGASMAFELVAAAVPVLGELSATIAAITPAATGAIAIAGTESSTIAAVTSSATGAVAIVGGEESTIANVSISGTGTVAVQGAASTSVGDISVAGIGTVADAGAVSGTLSVTLDAVTASASAAAHVQGAASAVIDDVVTDSAGAVLTHGEMAQVVDAITSNASGVVIVTGGGSTTIDAVTLSASGESAGPVSGELTATIAAVALESAGTGAGLPITRERRHARALGDRIVRTRGGGFSRWRRVR